MSRRASVLSSLLLVTVFGCHRHALDKNKPVNDEPPQPRVAAVPTASIATEISASAEPSRSALKSNRDVYAGIANGEAYIDIYGLSWPVPAGMPVAFATMTTQAPPAPDFEQPPSAIKFLDATAVHSYADEREAFLEGTSLCVFPVSRSGTPVCPPRLHDWWVAGHQVSVEAGMAIARVSDETWDRLSRRRAQFDEQTHTHR